MSRTRKRLVITAPDGTEVTESTSGNYTEAGIIQHEDGSWVIACHGTSYASVEKRTRTVYGRGSYRAMHVGPLREETAPMIREYFGTHAVRITGYFSGGQWRQVLDPSGEPGHYYGGRSMLLTLARSGVTAIQVAGRRPGEQHTRAADFQMSEIIRDCCFRIPQARKP